MCISSTSLPSLSLISLLITEIYYRTGITGNTDSQTDTHTETHHIHRYTITRTEPDTLPIQDTTRSSKKGKLDHATRVIPV